jgi:hypothetical protein
MFDFVYVVDERISTASAVVIVVVEGLVVPSWIGDECKATRWTAA